MLRLNVCIAILLIPMLNVAADVIEEPQSAEEIVQDDETTKTPSIDSSAYDSAMINSSEELFDPMKQPSISRAYQDFLRMKGQQYYPNGDVDIIEAEDIESAPAADYINESDEEFIDRIDGKVSSDKIAQIVESDDEAETTVNYNKNNFSNNINSDGGSSNSVDVTEATTQMSTFEQKTIDYANDVVYQMLTKELEEMDNSSSQLHPVISELTSSSKQAKMFQPSAYDSISLSNRNHMSAELDDSKESQLIKSLSLPLSGQSIKNETDDDASNEEIDDNDNLTLSPQFPSNTPVNNQLEFAQPSTTAKPTTTTTIMPPPKKTTKVQTTTPRIYKFSADEILRKFLEDAYIRTPMAALIDTSAEALRKTKILWKSALRPNAAMDIVLVAYNSSGIGVSYSFSNTRTMIAGLESVQESKPSDYDAGKGSSAFFGIMRASELVPYDSAIFISTDSIPEDIQFAQSAAIKLLKKRIRLYLIWFGPQSIDNNDTLGLNSEGGILGEVALRSGGEIIRVSEEALGPNGNLGLITLFLRNDIHGSQVLPIPIDTTVSNIQIKLQGNVETATLESPMGESTNLLNPQSVANFSNGSNMILSHDQSGPNATSNLYTITLNFLDKVDVGVYQIKTRGHSHKSAKENDNFDNHTYSVTVKATYHWDIYENEIFESRLYDLNADYSDVMDSDPKSERLISIVDESKDFEELEIEDIAIPTIFEKIKFPTDEIDVIDRNVTTNSEKLERNTLQAITKIELGPQSRLLANPGTTVQIYYEVTNLREEPTFHNFQVVDEKRYLRSLSPQTIWLASGQTTTAVVTAYIPPNVEIGEKDKITFTSQGLGLASQAATLTVTSSSAAQDSRPPGLWWGFGSRCHYNTDAGKCAAAIWSLEVTAQDSETGILRIQSKPEGLIIRNSFIAGTNNEVKATYTASCCTTRVTVTAFDLAGNQRVATVDVTEFILDEASIAAIVLGAILIILLIIIIILLIVWCCRRRKAERELNVYRSRLDEERRAAS